MKLTFFNNSNHLRVLTGNSNKFLGYAASPGEALYLANTLNSAVSEKVDELVDFKIKTIKLAEQLQELGLSYTLESRRDILVLNVFSGNDCIQRFAAASIDDDFLNEITNYVNDKKNHFFLIWSPNGSTPPKYKHYTLDNAKAEANRLADINENTDFYVLEAKSVHCNDGIPF